ncbi:MAG: hypothetical protein PHI93_04895 [Kiritimatiellae bacterium]|jgi:NADH:ubiquinone oxidoreductase subunit 6 (subunit J)|nr:hypothetical protein [Kiritimatiellia bacterium]
MIIPDLAFVFLFALVLAGILGWGAGWRHPASHNAVGTSVWFLFLVLMFVMWAGSAWLPPWGPLWRGTAWLSILVIGLLVSLLMLAIATPVRRHGKLREATKQTEDAVVVGTAFGLFFWILMIGLLTAIVVRYLV